MVDTAVLKIRPFIEWKQTEASVIMVDICRETQKTKIETNAKRKKQIENPNLRRYLRQYAFYIKGLSESFRIWFSTQIAEAWYRLWRFIGCIDELLGLIF